MGVPASQRLVLTRSISPEAPTEAGPASPCLAWERERVPLPVTVTGKLGTRQPGLAWCCGVSGGAGGGRGAQGLSAVSVAGTPLISNHL